jgi:hypothetical protein
LFILALGTASPVLAEEGADRRCTCQIGYVPPAEMAAELPASADLFGGPPPGPDLGLRSQPEPDAVVPARPGLIGSWSLSGAIAAGVGLFSVTADAARQMTDQKQREFKRGWRVKEVGARDQNIAAVGVSLSF